MYRIKKHRSGNLYSLTEDGIWVRDMKSPSAPLDINSLTALEDYPKFLENEMMNDKNEMTMFDPSSFRFDKAVVISDGYDFKNKHKILADLPNDVAIIAVNRSVVKWEVGRKIDFFLVNNPYVECMSLLPQHRYYPRCLASVRTYHPFVEKYKERGGNIMFYSPTAEPGFSQYSRTLCVLDDYRNPICAAVSLAYKIGVKKLSLFCCDDSFEGERPAAIKLENELWTYPHHLISHNIIKHMAIWYGKNKGIKIVDCSSGPVCEEIPYISADKVIKFFESKGLDG